METTSAAARVSGSGIWRAIVTGGLVAGACDITYAFVAYGMRGASPVRILQSVASGLLGRSSFEGGAATATLGAFLHFFIALTAAAVFCLASRRLPALARRPWLWGPLYGLAIYIVMNYVVIPLSAVPKGGTPVAAIVVSGVLVHMFLIGLSIALAARRFL
jgi:hypothetical protein